MEGRLQTKVTDTNLDETRKKYHEYFKRPEYSRVVVDYAADAFRIVVLQNRLPKKMSEIEGEYKSQIIDLQKQLLEKKDAEIASLKNVAESVERNVKSYSEMLSSVQSSQPAQPQLTAASIKRVVQDAV